MTDLTNLLAPIRARVETYRMYGEGIAHMPAAAYKLLAALEGVIAVADAASKGRCACHAEEITPHQIRAAVVAALGEGA